MAAVAALVALIAAEVHLSAGYLPVTLALIAFLTGSALTGWLLGTQGAEATRRYVRSKASIVVMEYKRSKAHDRYPWTQVGISERRYYKLLPQFAQKVNGRYDLDQDDVVARMKAYLDLVDRARLFEQPPWTSFGHQAGFGPLEDDDVVAGPVKQRSSRASGDRSPDNADSHPYRPPPLAGLRGGDGNPAA